MIILPTIIIFAIFGILYKFIFDSDDELFEKILGVIAVSFVGFLVGGFIWIVIGISAPKIEKIGKTKHKIAALKDKESVNGNFFLGSGYIQGSMQFFLYEEIKTNQFVLQRFHPSDVVIVEDIIKNDPYYLIKYQIPDPKWKWNGWGMKMNARVNGYEIHIPKGTIKHEYNLDLE